MLVHKSDSRTDQLLRQIPDGQCGPVNHYAPIFHLLRTTGYAYTLTIGLLSKRDSCKHAAAYWIFSLSLLSILSRTNTTLVSNIQSRWAFVKTTDSRPPISMKKNVSVFNRS